MMSLRFSSPAILQNTTTTTINKQHTGVVTRVCGYKYGFLKSEGHENIFFHFTELSDEAKAFVEPGCTVNFHMKENDWSADKKMKAIQIEVVSMPQENAFKSLEGICKTDMKSRGFTFIDCNETTYLFNITNLVNDDASNAAGNTVKTGHRVLFDAEYNHKYNPPKPYATNVRIIPGQDALNADCLECTPCSWQRGSRINLIDDDQEDECRTSISPSGRPSANLRSSVSDRASALKANGPARRWSRTTDTTGAAKSDKPSGGLRILETTCKFSRKCTRADCWFDHPKGRQIEDGLSMSDDDSDSGSDDSAKVSSMGKASLRLLVNALVRETGKSGYLTIRNALQKPEYVGRELTRGEKNSVGEILEELDTAEISKQPTTTTTAPKRSWRDSSSSRLNSRSSGGARVSLSDMCRDPSLRSSRISMSNQPGNLTDRPAIDVAGLFA